MATALTTRRDDYYRFHRVQVSSGDMDPVYPVLRSLADDLGLNPEARTWLVFCHVAYYHLGSALLAFTEAHDPCNGARAALDLPVATERRGHWSRPRLRTHLTDLQGLARRTQGGLTGWLSGGLYGTPEEDWATVQHRVASVKGNGRWASFKTTEMLQQVCGMRLRAPDMGHAHSSGPRKGLGLLYADLPQGNDPAEIAILDGFSRDLVRDMRLHGLEGVAMETVETSLCDFHSMVRGRYYPGHDIDQMQLQLDSVPSQLTSRAYRARIGALPHAYLGELHGRKGIDRERMIQYRTTGKVPTR